MARIRKGNMLKVRMVWRTETFMLNLTKNLRLRLKAMANRYIEHYLKPATPIKTGFLKNSWTSRVFAKQKWFKGGMKTALVTATVGTNVPYALYVEYGTRYQKAQAFMVKSFHKFWRASTARSRRFIPPALPK